MSEQPDFSKASFTTSSLKLILIPALPAYVVGGFLVGMMHPDIEGNFIITIFQRLFAGFVYMFFSMMSFGFPVKDFVKGEKLNAWPYIIGCWVIFMAAYYSQMKQENDLESSKLDTNSLTDKID